MKNQRKFKTLFKRLISGVSAIALSVGLLGSIPASADDSDIGYKYTLFAVYRQECCKIIAKCILQFFNSSDRLF